MPSREAVTDALRDALPEALREAVAEGSDLQDKADCLTEILTESLPGDIAQLLPDNLPEILWTALYDATQQFDYYLDDVLINSDAADLLELLLGAVVDALQDDNGRRLGPVEFPPPPSLPRKPTFSSNRNELKSVLNKWVQSAEAGLDSYVEKVEKWKEGQNQACSSQMEKIDKELDKMRKEMVKLERKKDQLQQKNQTEISHRTTTAETLVRRYKREITDTRGIMDALGGQQPTAASAPSADQDKSNVDTDNNNPPSSLCCPITLQLMMDPVMIVEDGQTYERDALLKHWRTQESRGIPITSPKTNQQLSSKQVAPNVLVRSQCLEWEEQHPNWRP